MGHGGERVGSGRKSKAEELGLPMLIEEVIGEDGKKELIRKIWVKAKEGSFQHQQLLAHYMFGKPQDKIDLKVEAEINHIITGMEIV
jgi:hypothetical protein